ncbi:MAG: glycosyltransferase family 4 protein [Candidatus Caldarchaeum sp.]
MVGPAPEVQGGISYVIRLMLKHAPTNLVYTMQPTILPSTTAAHLRGKSLAYAIRGVANTTFFLRSLQQVKSLIRSVDCNFVHIHFSTHGSTFRKYLVARVLHRYNTPYILHAHGSGYREFYSRAPALVKARIRWMMHSAEGLIVLSEQWREFYKGILGKSIRPIWVMPNPAELPESWQPAPSETLRLLFLGRMDERKGPDRVLRAIARVPWPLREHVRLYMAGDGNVDAVRRLAAELGLQAQVDIRNWIEGADKERWLRETNAFILPSRAEGLPMAMLEAMAYGKALIVSPVGGIPEFVSDGQEGFLVPPDDIEAISRAIATLAENPELRAQMGRAARARVEPLDVKRYMERMSQIYSEVLGARATSE